MSRDIFDAKMAVLKASQGKTGTMFSKEEYQQYTGRLKAISQPGYDMKPDDYYLVKSFKILRVEINGKIYDRLVKPGSRQLKFTTKVALSLFKSDSLTKPASQMLHLKGFFPS